MIDLITLDNSCNLIDGVILHSLKENKDQSGTLTEVLKTSWKDVYGDKYPFAQCYYSVTSSGVVRDRDEWHVHPTKQTDRFVCIQGAIVTAVYDMRLGSKTYGTLNLFLMGEILGGKSQFMVVIPQGTLHGFGVVSEKEAVLMNFPTTLYDPNEEGRIKYGEALAKFPDGSLFNWEKVFADVKTI